MKSRTTHIRAVGVHAEKQTIKMSIKKTKIGDSKKEGQYVFLEQGDFEYVNPVQQIMNMHIATMISFERDMLIYNGFDPNSPSS